MGQKAIIISIVVTIFAVIFAMLFILSRATTPTRTQKAQAQAQIAPKTTVSANDVISDPLVYDGLTVEIDTRITDWVTKKSFTVAAGGGGLLGGQGQLLIISKNTFVLPKDTPKGGIGLGETVNVKLKGRVRIMDRVELERAMGIDLDGEDIKLDDNNIDNWDEASVLLLHSVEKI